MREGRPFLNQVIADQPKRAALGKDRRIVIGRAVFEVKDQPAGHAIATDVLDQVAIGDNRTVERAQHQETMDQAFRVLDQHLRFRWRAGVEDGYARDQRKNAREDPLSKAHDITDALG